MSGAHATHKHGTLKAQVLAALAAGPLSSHDLATAIGYDGSKSALVVTLGYHAKQGTIERGPRTNREMDWGLPGTKWADKPAPPLPKRLVRAIKVLQAYGYTVRKAAEPEVLELPAREPRIATPAAPVRTEVSDDIAQFEAQGGRVERIPTPTPVPYRVLPAHPGTR